MSILDWIFVAGIVVGLVVGYTVLFWPRKYPRFSMVVCQWCKGRKQVYGRARGGGVQLVDCPHCGGKGKVWG